jgi:hypothetical protein
MEWLDPYEIRARISPTIIVFSPIVLLIVLTWPDLLSALNLVLGETILVIFFLYALSFLMRYYGRKIEPILWSQWNGAPSTRFMRWNDPTFSISFKEKTRDILKNQFNIVLLSREMENKMPAEADRQIESAFLQVKAFLYKNDPEGLWKKHNMEYGFNRNLVGSRQVWLILSIIGTLAFSLLWLQFGGNTYLLGIVVDSIEILCSIIVGWHYLPLLTKTAANRYAESAWSAFLVVSDKTQ